MKNFQMHKRVGLVLALTVGVFIGAAWAKDDPGESERKIKESEVPAAALKTLRELAGKAKLTEFAEEIEHGHTYYEGSWKGEHGNVDALVTASGDLVELEELIPSESAPKAILDKVKKDAGDDAKLYVEKKTVIFYEVKYRKSGRRHEVIYSPDGRQHEHEDEAGDTDDD